MHLTGPDSRLVPSSLSGVEVIESAVHRDERGFFAETYREADLLALGVTEHWVQENHSRSVRGTLRGLHFSVDPGQAKLVRCVGGRILDVAVDLRHGSPTFGHWGAVELVDDTARQVYISIGFAHGFVALSEIADVVYKCSAYYEPSKERVIAWDDPDIGIAWPIERPLLSARDASAPRLAEIAAQLPFVY